MKDLVQRKVRCPHCNGKGGYYECLIDLGIGYFDGPFRTCELCEGSGKLPYFEALHYPNVIML